MAFYKIIIVLVLIVFFCEIFKWNKQKRDYFKLLNENNRLRQKFKNNQVK